MCKFIYNYNLKCKKFIFFKDINFNILFLLKIKNLKKFHKICDFDTYYFFSLNPVLIVYYNKSLPYFFFHKTIKLLKDYSFFYYRNIRVSGFSYYYSLYLNKDIYKFDEFILNKLQHVKNYVYYYILLGYNLLKINNYKLLFKTALKNSYFFFNVMKNRIIYLLCLIISYNFSYFKKIYNVNSCLLLTNY